MPRCNFRRTGISRPLCLFVEPQSVLLAVTLEFLEPRLAIASARPTVKASVARGPQAHNVHSLIGLQPFDFYLARRLDRSSFLSGFLAALSSKVSII
jgi:hypothetical protein